jgi:iron-sulfur cluster repair protein YtfE (RIC family)
MTPIDRPDPVIMGHILAEHRELFEQLTALRTMLATESPPGCERLRELVRAIATLRVHLADHFRQEEMGGFLEEAVARMPRLGSAATDVLGQHPQLLADLDALVAQFGNVDDAPCAEAWRQTHLAFEAFMRHMQAHERAENAVVQQGYNEDLGLDD